MKSMARMTFLAVSAVWSGAAFAQPIAYGDRSGVNLDYMGIWEFSGTNTGTPLFNTPTVTGDTIDFNPTFTAFAAGANGVDITDGQINFTMVAKNNQGLLALEFNERGDYRLAGTGTAATSAAVEAFIFIDIVEVNFQSLLTPISFSTTLSFNPSAGDFFLGTDPVSGLWNGGIQIDISQVLANAGVRGLATKVEVAVNNRLVATSELGTSAFIAKKDINGFSVTAIVPTPASAALATLGGLLAARRRRA